MSDKKLPTIKLKGKDYVQVKDRILAFNEEYDNGMIRTEFQASNSGLIFKAFVIPDVTKAERFFVAHSAGNVQGDKAFEKLETVAIGRALALMGIGILEGVASADEIAVFHEKESKPQPKRVKASDIKWLPGDKLVSGVSNKTGNAWYAIQRGEDKIWLTKDQYDFIQDQTSNEPSKEPFADNELLEPLTFNQ